jgi:hypothetical protein
MEIELFETEFRIGGAERQRYVMGPNSPFPGNVIENDGRFEDIAEGERIVVSHEHDVRRPAHLDRVADVRTWRCEGGSKLTLTHQAGVLRRAPTVPRCGVTGGKSCSTCSPGCSLRDSGDRSAVRRPWRPTRRAMVR